MMVKKEKSTCSYIHHEEYGKEIKCDGCGGPMVCGPFDHACKNCDPMMFEPCVCKALRIYCCC